MQAGWEERRRRIDVGWCREGNGRVWKSDKDAPETCCRPSSKPATFREQNYLSENKNMSSRQKLHRNVGEGRQRFYVIMQDHDM